MADRKTLLTPLRKREVLFSDTIPREEKAEWGCRYLEEGRVMDALDFFMEARSRSGLENMRRLAVEKGDAFILRSVQKALPELVNQEHWEALEHNAHSSGREVFAEQAGRGGEVEMPVVDAVIKDDPTEHDAEGGSEESAGSEDDEQDESEEAG